MSPSETIDVPITSFFRHLTTDMSAEEAQWEGRPGGHADI